MPLQLELDTRSWFLGEDKFLLKRNPDDGEIVYSVYKPNGTIV